MSFISTIPRFACPYGIMDTAACLRSLVSGSTPSPDLFQEFLGPRAGMLWTRSGRHALSWILRSLDLEPGAGVATPLFNDPSVAQAIAAAGYRPVFVDVDEETLTIDPRSLARARNQVSAVVVVHYFGHLARMEEIQDVAAGIPIVEDTAHAPFSSLDGRPAGTFGAACFYSFASTKYWPAGGGGLAVFNDPDVFARAKEKCPDLNDQPLSAQLSVLIQQPMKALVFKQSFYGLLGRPLRPFLETKGILEPTLDEEQIQPGQASVALRQGARLEAIVERQRENSLHLLECIGGVEDVILPVERPGARYNYHLFPVLVSDKRERDLVRERMLARHVDTSKIHFNTVELSRPLGYEGGCPASESAADRMLTLPNYAALSNASIEYVAETFHSALKEARA